MESIPKRFIRKARRAVGALRRGQALEQQAKELHSATDAMQSLIQGFDSKHVWAFFSGHSAQDFRGNPKYLFAYINNYRPDIKAWWMADDEETLRRVRNLGWMAYAPSSVEAQYLISRTGVVVAEQVKTVLPVGLSNCIYLNLWHGIGMKRVERRLFEGDMAPGLAGKYIAKSAFYRNHMLMLVPSPTYRREFAVDCGVDDDKFIEAGYPRCLYQRYFKPVATFDHDLRTRQGLSPSTRIVVYAPTHRHHEVSTMSKALPDLDRLYTICEEQDLLFIFKMHPLMEKDGAFLEAKDHYAGRSRFLFWDNRDDYYEVMDQTDCLIVDYSSIISDAVAMGVKHFIRYVYDKDEYLASEDGVHEGYYERTCGIVCETFPQLLDALRTFSERNEAEDIERLNRLLWSYSQGADDFDRIIGRTLDFEVYERQFPTLYSFDIFDTLISRRVLDPAGIFYGVQERMQDTKDFPWGLVNRYPEIRHEAEMCEREYFNKSRDFRHSRGVEITLDDIFRRMAAVYDLNEKQVHQLETWELELELQNVVPLVAQIERMKELVAQGEQVVLISDMYLPKDAIKKMLGKADPLLAELPLYLSNEYGVLKTTPLDKGNLYFEVYKSFKPYYDFAHWIHSGDNLSADYNKAKNFNITPQRIHKPEFNDYQKSLVDYVGTYDAYLVAAVQARMCDATGYTKDKFVISYLSLCFVPYVDWVLRDALERGYQTLYFVSRDGHHLKRIADAIIDERKLHIKTRYLYGSRRLWRIPSYIDKVDDEYYSPESGNFNNITSTANLLDAMCMDRTTFRRLFPSLDLEKIDFGDRKGFSELVETFKNSEAFNEYILSVAEQRRPIVRDYLLQECNPDESFAVVEYYGRGYNQDCHLRLWRDAIGDATASLPYYYARSVLPSRDGSIRHNFTTNNGRQFFIEAVFANMPYKSIEAYARGEKGTIIPVKEPIPYDESTFDAMERLLPEFARRYSTAGFTHPGETDRLMFDYVFDYYDHHCDEAGFAESLGSLIDMTSVYGTKREYAPAYTMEDLDIFEKGDIGKGDWTITSDPNMSITRSPRDVRERFDELFQILPGQQISDSTRALRPEELAESRRYQKQYERDERVAEEWSVAYSEACDAFTVRKSSVIYLTGSATTSEPYASTKLKKELNKLGMTDFTCLSLKDAASVDVRSAMEALAQAEVIVSEAPISALSRLTTRRETTFILASNPPFILRSEGMRASWWLKQHSRYVSSFGVNDYSAIQIPSAAQKVRYEQAYCRDAGCRFDLHGSPVTDVYFDGGGDGRRQELLGFFPEALGKKIILYMPVIRATPECASWASIVDLEELQGLLGNGYAVVLYVKSKSALKKYANIHDVPGFCKVFVGKNDDKARELISAADIVVGDYGDVFFESVLTHKPIYTLAYDYESYLSLPSRDTRDFRSLDELLAGPLVRTARDLAKQVLYSGDYDYSISRRLRDTLFGYCDGQSTRRLANYIKNICTER